METVTVEENSSIFFFPNPNALFAISKGMWAVKPCANKMEVPANAVWPLMAVKRWLLLLQYCGRISYRGDMH